MLQQQIIVGITNFLVSKNQGGLGEPPSPKQRYWQLLELRKPLTQVLYILCGIGVACVGLKGFLLPNHILDGGAMGISLLLTELTHVPLSLWVVVVNLPFILLGARQFSRIFALKTLLAIGLLAAALALVEVPTITNNPILTPVFGGFLLGLGIGLAIRGGAVIDGTEILAIYLNKYLSASVGDLIFVINLVIFSFAAWLFTLEVALYSILTYMAASKAVDFVVDGIEEFVGLHIISAHSEQLRTALTESMGLGVTVYSGKHGYGKQGSQNRELDIICCVVTRLEVGRLKQLILAIDPVAFVYSFSIRETIGGMVRQKPLTKMKNQQA